MLFLDPGKYRDNFKTFNDPIGCQINLSNSCNYKQGTLRTTRKIHWKMTSLIDIWLITETSNLHEKIYCIIHTYISLLSKYRPPAQNT